MIRRKKAGSRKEKRHTGSAQVRRVSFDALILVPISLLKGFRINYGFAHSSFISRMVLLVLSSCFRIMASFFAISDAMFPEVMPDKARTMP